MKKFIIFFLMAFLFFGNSQARSEATVANNDFGNALHEWGSLDANSSLNSMLTPFSLNGAEFSALNSVDFAINRDCATGVVILGVDNPDPGAIYEWRQGATILDTALYYTLPAPSASSTVSYSLYEIGDITGYYATPILIATHNVSTNVPISVDVIPATVGATNPFNIGVNGSSVLALQAITNPNPYSPTPIFQWYLNDQPIQDSTNSTYFFPQNMAAGTYYVKVSATDTITGCVAMSGVFQVNVSEGIVVNIYGTQMACPGQVITLTAQVENDNLGHTYQWLRDGQYIAGQTAQTYSFATDSVIGTHNYSVQINRAGCESVYSPELTVTVVEPPVVILSEPELLCAGGTVTLEANTYSSLAEQPFKWIWFEGTAPVDTLDTTYVNTFVVDEEGLYSVEAIFENIACSALSVADSVTLAPTLEPLTLINDTTLCEGNLITLDVTDANSFGNATYQWFVNGMLVDGVSGRSYTFNPVAIGNAQTIYLISVFANYENYTCTFAKGSVNIIVNPNPVVEITGDPLLCDNGNLSLAANVVPTGTYTYQWYEDNVAVGTGVSPLSLTKTQRDYPYIYKVEVSGTNGCNVSSADYPVYVNENPTVVVTPSETEICAGGEVTFSTYIGHAEDIHYQWSNGGVDIVGATLPTYTTTLTETDTLTVTISQDGTDCEATGSAAVTVNTVPTITEVTLSTDTLCEGGQVTVTATGVTGGIYTWYINGILEDDITGNSFTESPVTVDGDVTNFVYSAYVTLSGAGCQSAIVSSLSLVVNPNPTVAITGDALLCNANTTTLTAHVVPATPVTGTYTYQWYLNNSSISGATSYEYTSDELPSSDNPYIFKLIVSNAYGCNVSSADYPVYVNENPTVVVIPSDTAICLGGEVTLSTYIGHAEDIHYQWSNGGVDIVGATLPTYTTTLTETDTLTVTITQDGTNCTATGSAAVTVIQIPEISLVLESVDTSICQGGEVILRDTNFQYHTDGVYQWYVNDVLIPGATQDYFSHYPIAVDGDMTTYYYNVSVTLPHSGCQSVLDAPYSFYMVDVYANPTVVIDGDNIVCNGSDLVLTANITGGVSDSVSYIWYNYNEVVGTEATLEIDNITSSTHQPNGVYSYTVAINQRTLGCSSVSAPFEVTVADSLTAVIEASTTEICAGGVVTFIANLNDWNQQDVTYKWFNDGVEIPGATSLVYVDTFMADAEISFEATRTYSNCVVTSNVLSIDVITNPTVTMTPTLATLCEGGEVTFTANASGSGVYTWYKNGVAIMGADLNILTESPLTVDGDSTIYTYYVMYTPETSGCSVAYDTAVVTVYPNVSVAIAGDPIICMDTTVLLTANVQDNYSLGTLHYQWKLFNVNTGTDNDTLIQPVPTSDNPYIYSVVVSNTTNNCQAESAPYYVYVNENPHVVVTVSDTLVCEGGTFTLTGHLGDYNTPNLTYQWLLNGTDTIPDATQITYIASITEDAYFTLLVRQTTSGCLATGVSPMIHVIDGFDGYVEALNVQTNSTLLCDGGEVQVTAYLLDGTGEPYIDSTLTYVWFRNGFLMSGVTGPQFSEALMTVDSDTSHYVYSVYVNLPGCGSLNRWFSQTITVRRNPIVIIAGDHVICEETDVALAAWVDGTYNLSSTASYRWYEHGQYRPNQNGNSFMYREPFEVRTDPYVFTVEFINPNGCSAYSEPFEVLINARPVVNITASEDSVCDGGVVTLRANLDNYNAELITFQWYENAVNDANIIPGATQIEYSPVIDETMTYYVEVIQLNSGCSEIDSYTITKFEDPSIASITLSVDTICEGGQVTITAALDETGVPGSDYIYTWYRNGALIPDFTGASFTESPLAVDGDITYYEYNVTVAQSAAGCASILNPETAVTLMVNPNPTVSIAGDPIVCRDNDNNIHLTANVFPVPAVEGTYTYQWFEDNVAIAGETDALLEITNPYQEYPYNFSVRVTNEYGCSVESDVFSVMVNDHPVVTIAASETLICTGGEITLTANLADWNAENVVYQWYKDGDSIPGATSITYTTSLTSSAAFTFTALQTTSECLATSNTVNITVNSLPIITDITVMDDLDTICEGRQVALMANVSGGVAGGEVYTWFRNGVEIPGAIHRVYTESPVTVDNEVTTYVYNVVVRQTAAGCASIYDPTDRVTITVNPNPTVTVAGDPIVCRDVDNNIVLSANVFPVPAVQGVYTYQWFEDNVAISGETAPTFDTHKPYQEYPYNFSVRVTNEYGCSVESEVFSVIVNEHPVVNITATETEICEGGEVTLTAHLADWNAGDIMYQWYANTTLIPGATSLNYTTVLNTTTTYTFTAYQTTSECLATSLPLTINVAALPVITSITVEDNLDTICEGRQVTMTANVSGGVAGGEFFTWFKNGVVIEGANQATYTESPVTVDNEVTTYVYNVVVRQTAAGCASLLDANDEVTIRVNPNPTVTVAGDPIVCRDDINNISLTANVFPVPAVQGVYTYQWFEDNVALPGETAALFDMTKPFREYPYNFSVRVTNEYGCSVESEVFSVLVNEHPVVNITATETLICEGGEVTLTAHLDDWNAGDIMYQWFAGGLEIPGATSLTYTTVLNATTTYTFTAYQTTSECLATSPELTITVNQDPIISEIEVLDELDTICEGRQVVMHAIVEGGVSGGEIFTWYRNGVIIPGATSEWYVESPLTVDNETTIYAYNAIVTQSASGCSSHYDSEDLVFITVNPNPTVAIEGDQIVCQDVNNNIVLSANVFPDPAVQGVYTYQWFEDNVAISGETNPIFDTHKDYRDYPYNFHVMVTNEYGCSVTSDLFYVYVNAAPVVTITSTETDVCVGGEITLTAHLNDYNADMLTYQWYADHVLIPGATSINYTTVVDETITFTVEILQLTSLCVTPASYTINVYPDPVIENITLTETQICEGGQVTVTANLDPEIMGVPGSAYTYTWFRNGELMPGITAASFTESPVTVDGDYTGYTYAAFVNQAAAGCQSNLVESALLNVYGNPRVTISGDAHICESDSVFLVANVDTISNAVGILHYTWYEHGQLRNNMAYGLGDSQFYSEHFYASENPYSFTVEVTRENGCTTLSDPFLVYVYETPVVTVTATETEICEGGQVTFTAHLNDINEANITYQWYKVDTLEEAIAVGYGPGNTYIYDTVLTRVVTDIPGATSPNYTVSLDTTSTYGVHVFQTYSECFDTDELTITVQPLPVIDSIVVVDDLDTICEGRQVRMHAYVSGGVAGGEYYTWYRNGVEIEGAHGPVYAESPLTVDNEVTTYVYYALVSQTASGCSSEFDMNDLVRITVNPNPTVAIAGDPIVCVTTPNNITLAANVFPDPAVQGPYAYQWFEDNEPIVDQNTDTLRLTKEFREYPYNFSVRVTNAYGCSVESEVFSVMVNAAPIVNITVSEDTICEGGELIFLAHLNDWNAGDIVYQWYQNGVAIPGATSLSYITNLNASDIFTFTAYQTSSGCLATSNALSIIVNPLPVITSISVEDNLESICEGRQVVMTANVSGGVAGGEYFTWFRNGVVIPGAHLATYAESPVTVDNDVTNYVYNVIVSQTAAGCTSILDPEDEVTIVVNPNPTVAIAGDQIVCVETENNINLNANAYPVPGVGGNYTYQWFEDNVAIAGATSANYLTTKPYREYPYNFSVIVTNQYGCSVESDVFSVAVNALPVITITSTETLICEGGEVTLTAHLADWNAGDIMYQWFAGGVAIPGATSLTYTTVLTDTTVFSFTALQTTSECLATSNSLTVNVNELPVITGITVADNLSTICEGRQVVMTANVSGGVTGGEYFTWYRNGVEIPDAHLATYTESPVTVDNDVTTYVYNVIVTQTAAGCTSILDSRDQVTIVVNPNPTVAIAGDQIVCVETFNNINLTANAYPVPGVGGNYTYQWFEDNVAIAGATSANYLTSKLYREYPYNFSVIVTNQYGCSVESEVFSVIVNASPVVNITVDETTICENGDVTLTAHLADWNAGDIVYQWSQNGVAIPGATSLTYTTVLTDTAVFSFTAFQTTSECLATSNLLTVFVLPTPVVAIESVLNANICSGGEVTLTATAPNTYNPAMGQATYTWYRNGVVVEGANQYVLTESPLAIDGDVTLYTYNVQVSFTASGCQSALSTGAVVTVAPTQTVYISANSNLTYCEGGNVVLTANVAPVADGYQYQWYRDNVLVGDNATYTSQDLARETAYEYHVVVSNNPGCSVTSESVYVTVVSDPVVNVTVDNSTICEGGVATFTANVEGGVDNINGLGTYTYAWYNNYSPVTPIGTGATYTTLATDQATTYTYWVVVTSPYGCQTTAYFYNFNIVADPTVNVAIASGYDATVCDGGSTMLIANVAGGFGENSYQWYKNGILLVGETNQTIATGALYNNVTAAYTVHVTQTGVNCDVWSQQFNVPVIPAPVVAINGNTNTCPGGTVTLTAVVSGLVPGDVPTYQWYKVANGIATPINGQTNAQFTTSPLLLGDSYEYYVEVISSISGCSVTSGTIQANVVPEPTVSIAGAHTVCEGGILTLNAYVNGGVSGAGYNYLWSWYVNGVLQTATTTVPSFVPVLTANDPSTPYYFTVNISRTDNSGCDATSSSFEVNVLPTPRAVVTMNNPVTCSGGSVTFTANVVPVGTYNYTWYVNGVALGNNQPNITLSTLPIGNNSIYVAISPVNANAACSSVSPTVTAVVVADPVVATVTPSVTAMCVGGTVDLSIGSIVLDPSINTGDYSYQWAINGFEVSGAINSHFSQNLNSAGSYSYTVRVSQNDGLGCASGWSAPVVVTVVNQPQVTITSGGYGLVDICQGGQVTLNGNVTNYSPVFGTVNYNWFASNINTGVTTNPYNATLNTVGAYNYNAIASFTGYACQPATSNTIAINVNADPSWSSIHVTPIGDMCEGERVTLEASVQGGVQDNVGNTNGIIQWYVVPEGGNAQYVDGGVGGSSWDDPDGYGNFDYFVTYSGQLGSGCSLANGIPNINSNGFTMTVHALPTAQFTSGDGGIICSNDINDIAGLEITFTGTAPFYFMLQDVSTNQTTAYGPIYQNPYTVYVQPDVTTTYRIINLTDAYCAAAGDPITGAVTSATVIVSDVQFAAELYTTVCGEFDINGYPIARININILSGFATNYDATFVDPANAMFNVYNGTILGSATMGYYLEFSLPSTPGDYDVVISIDGCEYLITVRVLVAEDSFGGQPIVDQRWDDVVVVNNNPANNGGHTFTGFQWYKDGVLIPGATNQYYQEIGGLDGLYSVALYEYNSETGEYIEYMTCEFFFSSRTNIKVYPVPAETQQQITIELNLTPEEFDGAILDIYDVRGAHVQQINSLQPVTKVDGFKTPGTYFGRIITGTNEIKTVKFIIVK